MFINEKEDEGNQIDSNERKGRHYFNRVYFRIIKVTINEANVVS